MNKYLDLLKQISKTLLVIYLIGLMFLVIILIVAIPKKIFLSEIIFINIVFIVNTAIIIFTYIKDKIIPYLAGVATIITEILLLIIISMTKI